MQIGLSAFATSETCPLDVLYARATYIVREDGETFAFFGKPSHKKRTRLKPTTAAIAATVPCNAMQCHANKQEIQDIFEEIMHEKIFVDVKAVTSVVSGLSPSKC